MGSIRTVLGEIDTSQLSYCHAHEHVWIDGDIDDYGASLRELCLFKSAGGSSLVDAQPLSAGGNIEQLKRLSNDSGVNIIAAGGFHLDKYYDRGEIPAIRYHQDIGIMKCALDVREKAERYRAVLEETIGISMNRGLPLLVHVERNARVDTFIEYLEKKHMPMDRVILCHMDRACDDLKLHEAVLREGCYLEYDTIGRYKYHDDDRECDIINHAVSLGYEDRILLGLDTTKARLLSYGGTPGLCFIRQCFEECMVRHGINEGTIKKFMETNPRNAFTIG